MFFGNYIFKQPSKLFGTANAKTKKGELLGYTTYILYMSPATQNTKGKNLCAKATDGCKAACLFTAGRGRFNNVAMARLHKTEWFLKDREAFMLQVATEIAAAVKKHGAKAMCVRLNGTTDIPFENIKVGGYANIMAMFASQGVQFYDYTKVFSRLNDKLPSNYHLTFSRAETGINQAESKLALELGYNVAAVFGVKDETELPKKYMGYPVINGDQHDLTFLHPKGHIIGLKAKGILGKKDTSGFVIRDF